MDNGEFNMEYGKENKEPDYIWLSQNNEKFIVQKSNPLLSLSENGISLCELKLPNVAVKPLALAMGI